MIRFTRGDLFGSGCQALVNPVNCVGVMGRGLALQFRHRFPANYEAYRTACARREVRPGRCLVFDAGAGPTRFVVNVPTKRHWRDRSRIEDVAAGLDDLAGFLRRRAVGSVAIPPLGCGLGGLPWPAVRSLIVDRLASCEGVSIVVFEPDGPERRRACGGAKRGRGRREPSALLIGLVKGPSFYNPHRHPGAGAGPAGHGAEGHGGAGRDPGGRGEGRPASGGSESVQRVEWRVPPTRPFVDLVRRQVRRDYDIESLRTEGLRIFTTLDPSVQASAEQAMSGQIAKLEAARGARDAPLQGALAVTATGTGEVLAVVGSRDPDDFGFNRALDAVRPIGSLAKPAVYLAALSHPDRYTAGEPGVGRTGARRRQDGQGVDPGEL